MPEREMPKDPMADPRFNACLDFLGRTGPEYVKIMYHDDEAPPVIWMVLASWNREGTQGFEIGAAFDPLTAVLRLCTQTVDGGRCRHCGRPTGFEAEEIETQPMNNTICWYQYDPELKEIRRGCAGD